MEPVSFDEVASAAVVTIDHLLDEHPLCGHRASVGPLTDHGTPYQRMTPAGGVMGFGAQ